MGTVRNRKQDREEPREINRNNLDRLGTVPIAETKQKTKKGKQKPWKKTKT